MMSSDNEKVDVEMNKVIVLYNDFHVSRQTHINKAMVLARNIKSYKPGESGVTIKDLMYEQTSHNASKPFEQLRAKYEHARTAFERTYPEFKDVLSKKLVEQAFQ